MLVLLDQATPVPIRNFLREHDVETAFERGWDTLKNGDLLKAAEDAGFDVFVTPDKNMRYNRTLRFAESRSSSWAIHSGLCYAYISSVSLLPSTAQFQVVARKWKYRSKAVLVDGHA